MRFSFRLLVVLAVTALFVHRLKFTAFNSHSAENGRKILSPEPQQQQQQIYQDTKEDARCLIKKADILYTFQRILNSELLVSPYPHAIITDFFSPKIYKCILRNLKNMRTQIFLRKINSRMSPKEIEQARRSYNELNTPSHLERLEQIYDLKKESKMFWQTFPAIMNNEGVRNNLLKKFQGPLLLRAPRFEFLIKPQTFSRQLLTIDGSSYAIRPHTDTVDKLVTILIYLPEDRETFHQLGTLLLQRKNLAHSLNISGKQRAEWEDFNVVKQAPFEPNVALAFSACDESWHAVKEVEKMKTARISLQTFIMKKNTKGEGIKERVGSCARTIEK